MGEGFGEGLTDAETSKMLLSRLSFAPSPWPSPSGREQELSADYRYSAAGLFYFLASAFSKAMRRNFERFGNLAIAKHNDVMLRLPDQSAIVKHFRRHFVVRIEMFLQRLQTYFDPFL